MTTSLPAVYLPCCQESELTNMGEQGKISDTNTQQYYEQQTDNSSTCLFSVIWLFARQIICDKEGFLMWTCKESFTSTVLCESFNIQSIVNNKENRLKLKITAFQIARSLVVITPSCLCWCMSWLGRRMVSRYKRGWEPLLQTKPICGQHECFSQSKSDTLPKNWSLIISVFIISALVSLPFTGIWRSPLDVKKCLHVKVSFSQLV